ncbi:unnamed protein product [Polarella glacialis]|uniref:Calpain catalytic domain-containing protein n=1 Tax=Polarella glacialis TaxID=89957 RepID=A0A813I417_POLGL|nr:unnamed protein product [Polarella glacialis]CAE8644720.1 unnamed protein product [Polarella glacialis]
MWQRAGVRPRKFVDFAVLLRSHAGAAGAAAAAVFIAAVADVHRRKRVESNSGLNLRHSDATREVWLPTIWNLFGERRLLFFQPEPACKCQEHPLTPSSPSRERAPARPWEDPAFAGAAAIGATRARCGPPGGSPLWTRATELRGHGRLRLFAESFQGAGAGAVRQGGLGDCWLMGVFACLAEFPGHAEALFEQRSLQLPDGRYSVNLFDPVQGCWRSIQIDDRVPCHSLANDSSSVAFQRAFMGAFATSGKDVPCFGQPMSGELWPLLLEKAFAKVAGSYGGLEGGLPEMAFQMLTGQKEQVRWERVHNSATWSQLRFVEPGWRGSQVTGGRYQRLGKVLPADDLFFRLAYYDQANFLLAASIHTPGRALEHRRWDGLHEGHAYSILEVQEAHGVRLIRLRNPWGQGEWNGNWSKKSASWALHPEAAADVLREGPSENGAFWMCFEDFASIFHSVMVCPATMPVPKASRYVSSSTSRSTHALPCNCGRCARAIRSRWLLVVALEEAKDSQSGDVGGGGGQQQQHGRRHQQRRQLRWQRLQDGDLCLLCLRATAQPRRQLAVRAGTPATALEAQAVGRNGAELRRQVPGVDYFPFEAGAGCVLPGFRPTCQLGAACILHSPEHFAEYDHPWMRPGPEVLQPRRGSGVSRGSKQMPVS